LILEWAAFAHPVRAEGGCLDRSRGILGKSIDVDRRVMFGSLAGNRVRGTRTGNRSAVKLWTGIECPTVLESHWNAAPDRDATEG
jgi:hypothetical protein